MPSSIQMVFSNQTGTYPKSRIKIKNLFTLFLQSLTELKFIYCALRTMPEKTERMISRAYQRYNIGYRWTAMERKQTIHTHRTCPHKQIYWKFHFFPWFFCMKCLNTLLLLKLKLICASKRTSCVHEWIFGDLLTFCNEFFAIFNECQGIFRLPIEY